jgi:hypothetical protein
MYIKDFAPETFVETFNNKFQSFCEKAPVLLSFKADPEAVYIENITSKKIKKFKFNYEKTIEENIYYIRKWLESNWYPRLLEIEIEEEDYSPEELEQIMEEKEIPLEEAVFLKKQKYTEKEWLIEKVVLKKDEILLKPLFETEPKTHVYKLSMPTTTFLKRLREGVYTKEIAWDILQLKGQLKYIV